MRSAIGKWLVYGLSALLLAMPALAAMPLKLGELELEGAAVSMLISEDQRYLYVQLRAGPSPSPKILLIDVANPAAPVVVSQIPTSSIGQMALTPDGKWLRLIAPIDELPKVGDNKQHELTTFDVSQPAQPRLHSRQNLLAKQVTLAPDASAYATYRETGGERSQEQIEVHWLDSGRPAVQLKPTASVDLFQLMPGGDFVVYGALYYEGFEIADLRQPDVRLYRQSSEWEFKESLNGRLFIGMLDDGRWLFNDERTPRIGVYATQPALPRVAKLSYTAKSDRDRSLVELGRNKQQIFLRDEKANLFTLNIADPAGLRLTDAGISAPGCRRDGCLMDRAERLYQAAQESEFQSKGSGRLRYFLRIFDTRQTQPPAFSWQKLAEVHRLAMPRHLAAKRGSDEAYHAFRLYELVSPLSALSVPPDTLSNRAAAKIVSEYAGLLAEHSESSGDVKALLQYAIQLDGNLAAPHLQMAKLLRQSLPKINNWPDKLAAMQQTRQHYLRYLALGGKSSADIAAYLANDPVARSNNICEAITHFTNAGRLEEILSETGIDVPKGNQKLDLIFATEGTLHNPVIFGFDSVDDKPLGYQGILTDDNWQEGSGGEVQLAVFGDAYHILFMQDLSHPVASTTLSGDQTCTFTVQTTEKLGPKASEPALCRLLQGGKASKSIPFTSPLKTQGDYSGEYIQYSSAEELGKAYIDFANDGKPAYVGKIRQSQRSSCGSVIFDTLDKQALGFVDGRKHEMLMKLQEIDIDSEDWCPIWPRFNDARFFKYRGNIYYENKAKTWPPDNDSDQIHRVSRVKNGKVIEVCDYQFATRVSKGVLKNTRPKPD